MKLVPNETTENTAIDVEGLKSRLIGIMKEKRTYGAYDVDKKAFVIGHPDDPDAAILILHPKIITTGADILLEELDSDTRLVVKVKRPKWVRARVVMEDGNTTTVRYEGFTSRFFQQMYDKLQGYNSRDRANRFHIEQAERKMKRNAKR
jgi:peptide deformylase